MVTKSIMDKPGSPSLTLRVILALVLMVGFYLLAMVIAAALLFLVYLQVSSGSFSLYLLIFCVIGAGIILWAIIPRVDRFDSPGPRLTKEQHPRLFTELTSIAGAVGQDMPLEVYLIPDVNAWVSQRGGMMGMGGATGIPNHRPGG